MLATTTCAMCAGVVAFLNGNNEVLLKRPKTLGKTRNKSNNCDNGSKTSLGATTDARPDASVVFVPIWCQHKSSCRSWSWCPYKSSCRSWYRILSWCKASLGDEVGTGVVMVVLSSEKSSTRLRLFDNTGRHEKTCNEDSVLLRKWTCTCT